ncbi:hypothetical protein [Glutamicibacter arilaitensis]|uniref:Uncharacterized protein n=2 Tax=Micrococcaceae TaxID=1268 RepID=A0A2N7S0V1_9MICC|nr:hypothetical protein [Glutamicibacter arilaitensis]PMQ19765.1 hypothetical protein CIK84_14080 [Glutamicibacter arilaitensis]HCM96065.1 hypothetical protein [Glutamicibacter sp.]
MSEHLLPTLRIPETFTEVTTRQEHQGTTPVTVTRHHPGTDPKYGGEHVTTVFGDDRILYGYTRQISGFEPDAIPTTGEAHHTAFEFLRSIDSGFTEGLTVQWIDRHDETIRGEDEAPTLVSGMKVKTRHSLGLYTWVIVGAGNQIVTYERDIEVKPREVV